MFGIPSLYLKLAGGAIAFLALLGLVLTLRHYKHEAEDRGAQLAAICAETRTASGVTKLDCKQVPQQIVLMGQAIGTLRGALDKQSVAVAAMGAETARQQDIAVKAENLAAERGKQVTATQQRLDASSRSDARKTAPCAPSEELLKGWK